MSARMAYRLVGLITGGRVIDPASGFSYLYGTRAYA